MANKRSCLVLAPRFPLPKRSGTQIREFHALSVLARRFDVTLVSLVHNEIAFDYISEIEDLGVTVETVHHDRSRSEALARFCASMESYRTCRFVTPAFRQRVHSILDDQSFDLVWVNFATTVPALPPSISAPIVVDEHNEDVRYWESFLNGGLATQLFAHVNIWKLRRFRRRLTEKVDGFLAVSNEDAERTKKWAGEIPVWTVPNGVDIDEFSTDCSAGEVKETIRFIGSLDVRMNTDALSWFVKEVWPTVRDRRPDATFEVVGRNPTAKVQQLESAPGVRIRGEVDSIIPWYRSAALTVAPFRFGGGSKLKVLESLSMRRPVVATPVGAVGLDVTSDVGVPICEDVKDFINIVVELLSNPSKRTCFGDVGREFVAEHYAWDEIMETGVKTVEMTLLD